MSGNAVAVTISLRCQVRTCRNAEGGFALEDTTSRVIQDMIIIASICLMMSGDGRVLESLKFNF